MELDGRMIGGSALLIPFADTWFASTSCRQFLEQVINEHLHQPDVLSTNEQVSMFIIKQHDNVRGSGRKTRVDKDLANATSCLDMTVLSISESFSAQYFTFKITSRHAAIPPARSLQTAFEVMTHEAHSYINRFLPPRLGHIRMYSNHQSYNSLLASLEERELGWTSGNAKTYGKRFVGNMSKTFF